MPEIDWRGAGSTGSGRHMREVVPEAQLLEIEATPGSSRLSPAPLDAAGVVDILRRAVSPPGRVATLVFLVYGLWLAVYFASGHDARVFIALDRKAVAHRHAGGAIRYDPTFPYNGPGYGYDGGWFYLIALDPVHARDYVDSASLRYTKILYPVTARLLALGRADLIPYTLILVNWMALGLGTYFLAAWLRRRGLAPVYALLYSFYYGLFIGFQRDLTEPLSYALVLAAVYLYDFGGRRRLLGSSACFAPAILARDKAAVFAIIYGLALLFSGPEECTLSTRIMRNLPCTVLFLAIAGLPMLAYKLFLHFWLGAVNVPLNEQAAPLQGIFAAGIPVNALAVESISVFVPALICGSLAVWALWQRIWRVEVVLLLVMIELTVVTLNPGYFVDMRGVPRVGTSIVVTALLCLPWFDRVTRGNRTWLRICGMCWVAVTVVTATAALFLAAS
jgi:hypothetical protein